jgi:cytosine/adenosine deaminase-related metal-dependent hydrolase
MFTEMRTAALLQKGLNGPEILSAKAALRMATTGGAKALGLDAEIGTVEVGKKADLTVIDLGQLHTAPSSNVVSSVVYSAEANDVRTVLVDGRVVMEDRELLTLDEPTVIQEANSEAARLITRAGLD